LRRLFQLGSATFLAGVTQLLGLGQIALLLWPHGASEETNAYFLMATWTQLPVQVILIGLMYPVWLRGVGLARTQSRNWVVAVPLLSAIAALVAALFFRALSGAYPLLVMHSLLFATIGVLSAVAWAGAVRLSAEGKPGWLASVTLMANLVSCACLVGLNPDTSGGRVTALLVGQTIGWLIGIAILAVNNPGIYRQIWTSHATSQGGPRGRADRGNYWYLVQASAGYGSNLAIQTQTAALPSTALSTLGVFTRILAGMSALTTNAILPRLVHSTSLNASAVYRYIRISLLAATSVGLLLLALAASDIAHGALALMVIPGWFAATSLNAAMKRVAVRELPPRVAWISTTANLAMPIVVVSCAAFGRLSFGLVLGATIALDLLPGVALALILKQRKIALISALLTVGCVGVGVLAIGT
jgi:hypothetical protein